MGAVVRIAVWVLTGMLINAGMPKDLVDVIAGDASLHLAIEQIVFLIAGGITAVGAGIWRRLALRCGWST